uniref:Proteasome assembly chaperone 3 n=1 Tax=Hyaloperonospora arabidopsidis (strain Emoy2) TaxID=559515 RepID=M4B2S1_HYAAE
MSSTADDGMRVIDLSGTLLDQGYVVQLWLLSHCIFVYMGTAADKPRLASLSTAIATRYSPMPLITSVLGASDTDEQQIAQRLARRTGRQCFVSCQLPSDVSELFVIVERHVIKRLTEEGVVRSNK